MIDWGGVAGHALWIGGLALDLAAVSLAHFRTQEAAQRQTAPPGRRLAAELAQPGTLLALVTGLALVCAGLLIASPTWWIRVPAGLLALFLGVQAAILGTRLRRAPLDVAAAAPALDRHQPGWLGPSWLGWGLLAAGVVVLVAWVVVTGLQVRRGVDSLQGHLRALEALSVQAAGSPGEETADLALSSLGPTELEEAGHSLAGAHQDLASIQRWLGPLLPLGRLLRWVPGRGGDLAAAAELVDLATTVSAAGDRSFQALQPALALLAVEPSTQAPATARLEALLPRLVAAGPELRAAQQDLAAAQALRQGLDGARLSPQVVGLLGRLDRALPALRTAVDAALVLPGLVGADGPRTYLVLVQNQDELRATGGFLSGVGELRVEDGRLVSVAFEDSYAVDNLAVPHQQTPVDFQRVLLGELWFFRDTNWDPDFAASAERALDVYARDRGVVADGAIALDLAVLRALLEVTGPVDVVGMEQPVTAGNVGLVVQAEWGRSGVEGEGDWWLHRKDFMGEIAQAVTGRLLSEAGVPLRSLAEALAGPLQEKHLLVYVRDDEAAGLLERLGWDGALTPPTAAQDRLLVVDSNVGFNKVDANVARFVEYRVDLGHGQAPRARLAVTYRNHSTWPVSECVQESRPVERYAELMEGCYWNYLRVYVPAGSVLLKGPAPELVPGSLSAEEAEATGQAAISPTLSVEGWQVWAAFFSVAAGEERAMTFEYSLPAEVVARQVGGTSQYRLQVHKQPGTEAVPLRVAIILPARADIAEALPPELTSGQGIITDLRIDREFEVTYRR